MSIIPPDTPAEGWDAFNARKQKEREEGNHVETHDENQPESRNLTREEIQIFENARQAVDTIRKTFETWMVIARGVEAARKRADRIGGKQVFERILEQQGLHAVLGKTPGSIQSTAVRLLKILENLPEIEAWRASLTSWERIQWSSPTAVYKYFPGFQRQAELDSAKKKERKPTPADRIKELEAENAHLQEELARHDTPARPQPMWHDGIDMSNSVQDIASAMCTLDADKAKDIAKAIIGEPPAKPAKPDKSKAKGLKGFVDEWKPIRKALKDADALTPDERQQLLSLIEYDIGEAKAIEAPAPEAKAEAPAPATESKPMTFPDRKNAAIQRARDLGYDDLAKQIEEARYAKQIEPLMEELARREAEKKEAA